MIQALASTRGTPNSPLLVAIPVKFSEKQRASHYLYVRQHRVRQDTQSTWPPNRTLFILNVPPYCTEVSCWQRTGGSWKGGGLPWALQNSGGQVEMPVKPQWRMLKRPGLSE